MPFGWLPASLFALLHLTAMANGLRVSVLDLVGMGAGETAGSAIARSVHLAQHVEQWGYKRFWLAEHHAIHGLACSATPVLIGHVAGATNTLSFTDSIMSSASAEMPTPGAMAPPT